MDEQSKLKQAIEHMESQRILLGDAVVDAAIASMQEKLKQSAARAARREKRKQVTVLFSDLVGFTTIAEKMDAEDIGDIMSTYFAAVTPPIVKHGGVVEKYIGDAIMAVFGIPQSRESDPENAIRAALQMHEALAKVNAQLEKTRGFHLQMRIGINTGPVVAAMLSDNARDFTIVGDTVNTASRLESAAPVNGILISHDTYRHVRGVFSVNALDPIRVKGKAERLQVYAPWRLKPQAFRVTSRGVEGIETQMIGRKTELAFLQKLYHRVADKKKLEFVTIVGEAGLGKSRLLYEFENWYELSPIVVKIFKGRATEVVRRIPFSLIRDLFSFRFQIQNSDSTAVARQKLEDGFISFMGDEGLEKSHFVGQLLGLDFSDSEYIEGIRNDARQIHDRAFHYVAQFFQAVTTTMPALMLLEDIHWADDASLELLEYIINYCVNDPLLAIGVTRPSLFEKHPKWNGYGNQLDLKALSIADSRLLVREILQRVPTIPPALQETVVSHADGNPFYLEELIKVLIEDGVIVKREGDWKVVSTRLAHLRVPSTLTGVLQARLDRLSPTEYEVLQRASIMGRTFWDESVVFLQQRQTDGRLSTINDIAPALEKLVGKELIIPAAKSIFSDSIEYRFKHTIFHDVIYESVLKSQRSRYHQRAAAWLLGKSGDRADEHAGLIASHYEMAGMKAKAAKWYGRAGAQAEVARVPESAIAYYRNALTLADLVFTDDMVVKLQFLDAKIKWYHGLGKSLRRQGMYNEAIEAFINMTAVAQASGNIAAQARAWNSLSFAQGVAGDHRSGLNSAKQAALIAQSAGGKDRDAQVALAQAYYEQGFAHYRLGEMQEALTLGEEALRLSILHVEQRHISRSLNLVGAVYHATGRYAMAVQHHEQALPMARSMGDRRGESVLLNNLGEAALALGDYEKALQYYVGSMEIARDIGDKDGELASLGNYADAQVRLANYPEAIRAVNQVINETSGNSAWYLSETYKILAEAQLALGEIEPALKAAQQALTMAQETESQMLIGGGWRTMGEIAAHPNWIVSLARLPKKTLQAFPELKTPTACFRKSEEIFINIDAPMELAQTLRVWARYELEEGNRIRGQNLWRKARSMFLELDITKEVRRMDAERSVE